MRSVDLKSVILATFTPEAFIRFWTGVEEVGEALGANNARGVLDAFTRAGEEGPVVLEYCATRRAESADCLKIAA